MNIDQQIIDLATRIQRRHDFSSHVTGFLCGAVILGALLIAGIKATDLYLAAVLSWATALSFQHFRQVLRGRSQPTQSALKASGSAVIPNRMASRNSQPPARIYAEPGTADLR